MSDSEDPIDIPEDGGDDLFGDGGDDAPSEAEKNVSEQEQASERGEDEEGDAHARDSDEEAGDVRDKLVAEVPLYRHRIPRSKDGSVSGSREIMHARGLFPPY